MPDPSCDCLACRVWFGHTSLAEGSVPQRSLEIAEAMDAFHIFLMNVLTAIAFAATYEQGYDDRASEAWNAR